MKTFKDFMIAIGYLPATIFSGLTSLLLGYTTKDNKDRTVEVPGLLGLILDAVRAVGRGIAKFVETYKTEIAIAFWASLFLAGAAALTVFLWPAALTAVAGFTVGGISIAALVGADALLQIAAIAALTAVATSTAVYLSATVVNTIAWLVDCCKQPSDTVDQEQIELEDVGPQQNQRFDDATKSPFQGLGGPVNDKSTSDDIEASTVYPPIVNQTANNANLPNQQLAEEPQMQNN